MRPLTRCLAFIVLSLIGIGAARAWLGEHSVLIGALSGMGITYLAAHWFLCRPGARERSQQAKLFLSEHWRVFAQLALYALAFAYLIVDRDQPSEPAVARVLLLVEGLGVIAAVVGPTLMSVIYERPIFSGVIPAICKGLVTYAAAMWVLGNFGDGLYRWTLESPRDAAIYAATFVVLWLVFRAGCGTRYQADRMVYSAGLASLGVTRGMSEPSARDNRYTAAHEAGHALVYAPLRRVPDHIELAINERPDDQGVLGYITGVQNDHLLQESAYAVWHMLVLLAGKLGEARIMGDSTLGSSNDHARWLDLAKEYLANHHHGMFYTPPKDELEQKQNEAQLRALQAAQLSMLSRFFDLNSQVHEDLTDALLEKRRLTRTDLIPFLARVRLPSGFPCPFGEFDTFGAGED